MTLLETLNSIGIADTTLLPEKTQRKLKEYNKVVNNPLYRNKKSGEFHPGAKVKLDDLAEDILLEAKLYLRVKNTPPPPPPLTEEEEAARKRAEEEAAEKAKAEEEAAKKKAEEEAAKSNKKGGLLNWLFED